MAAAAPIALGLQVASSVMQAGSQAKALNYNAGIDKINAQQALQDGASQTNSIMDQARATQGSALEATAVNGVQVGTGSALDALRQTAINAQFNALNARAQAQGKANAYMADAAAKKDQANTALFSGLLGAGAKALSGGAFGGGTAAGSAAASVPGLSAMPVPMSYGFGTPTAGIYGVSNG